MCTILTALSAASSVAGFLGQSQQAEAQAQAQANASEAERSRASQEGSQIRLRQGQQRVGLANEMEKGFRQANRARATAAVASAEGGVGGRVAELIDKDITVKHAMFNRSLVRQSSENDLSSDLQAQNAALRSEQNQIRINQPIAKPNPLALIGSLIGGVAQAQTQEANFRGATGRPLSLGGLLGLNIGGTGEGQAESVSAFPQAAIQTQPDFSSDGFGTGPNDFRGSPDDIFALPQGGGGAVSSLLPQI